MRRNLAIRTCALLFALPLAGCGKSPTHPGSSGGSGTGSSGTTSSGQTDGGLPTIPLTGCPLWDYFVPATIAGQPFTFILDTGSSDTAVALSTCSSCNTSAKLTPPANSCQSGGTQQMSLGWFGNVCSESMSVGAEMPAVTVNMVGITSTTSFFTSVDCPPAPGGQPQYQGILGMGPPGIDTVGDAGDDAYFTELVADGVAPDFSLLLCSVGGRMWLGGYDPQFASGPPQFTPLAKPTGWAISVSSIGLGSTNLGPGDPQTIVDTGTQFYSMPSAAYAAFMNQADPGFTTVFGFNTLASAFPPGTACVVPEDGLSQAQINADLQPLILTLPATSGGSFTLSLPATSSYLAPGPPVDGGAVPYCLAVRDQAATGNFPLLGAPLLRANITLFDLANSRLGFIPQSSCQ